jgi:hypothetical protein
MPPQLHKIGYRKSTYVVDKLLPSAKWHVARRTVRIQPGETLGPGARKVAIMLDDRDAFYLGLAPGHAIEPVSTVSNLSRDTRRRVSALIGFGWHRC